MKAIKIALAAWLVGTVVVLIAGPELAFIWQGQGVAPAGIALRYAMCGMFAAAVVTGLIFSFNTLCKLEQPGPP